MPTSTDLYEARSVVYNTQRIVRLASGAFALCGPWDNETGFETITIGTLTDLEPLILSSADISAPKPLRPAIDLMSLLRPAMPKLNRRF